MKITKCRVCNHKVKPVGSIGDHFINDFPSLWPHKGKKVSLNVVECGNCWLAQLDQNAPLKKLYEDHYWYRSGINKVISIDLSEIAKIAMANMIRGDTIIDVGANDGTLLKYITDDFYRVGVEPAKNLTEELKTKCDEVYRGFWENYPGLPEYKKAKVITAIGMFYDSEDPNLFIHKVKMNLSRDGLFIAQLMTLAPMIEKNDVGNICHEHIEYYSYPSLVELFERNGLEIVHVDENTINGGSYRIFAKHYQSGSLPLIEKLCSLKEFFQNIERNKIATVKFIKEKSAAGCEVYAYGASTKGNTVLQYYGLGPKEIVGAADANPEKFGRFMLTGIPIVDEDEARKKADYFFILPWAFTDMFIEKERSLGYKGKFIVSTPEFKVI